MFNKIIKRSHRKTSKSDSVDAQSHINCGQESTNVTVNHASRTSEANPSTVSSQPPSLSLTALPCSGAVEILPSLRDAAPIDRPGLFLRKLQICCVFFDFSSTLKSVREKEIKRQTLAELVELVHSGSAKMNEWMQQEMVSMIAINLFRCLPPASYENTGCEVVDPEEDEPYLDPSWPHLQLLYDLLLKYVVSAETDNKVAKRYVDHVFVLKLLNLFDSEDPREREYLKTILHRIYGKFMVHRPFIRTAISNVFYRFIFETERHSGIGELLEILGSIINGFALPMKQEHKLFLVRALIPLHKPKAMSSYHQQLSYCVIQFVEKDYRLADVVIRGLLKYWPITNCQKEILFLGELEEVLEGTHSAEFQCCIVPLFRQIGRCLNSPHFQVAERALFLWNNEHVVSLIAQNRELVFPIIFEPLERNIQNHWNQAIHGLTSNVQKLFQEMDSQLFEECERQHSHKEASAVEEQLHRQLLWKRIEDVASLAVQSIINTPTDDT